MKNNLNKLMIGSFTFLGALCITSGIAMPKMFAVTETSEIVKLSVTQKKVSVCKSNEIKLNDIEIEIIIQHIIYDYSFKELSKIYNKPINTIISIYNRAKKKLKERYESYEH